MNSKIPLLQSSMPPQKHLFALTGLLASLLISPIALPQPQPKPSIPSSKPNLTLKVARRTGNCPPQVSLWTASRQYEGGGETTMIADTVAIAAAPVRLITATPQLVEFKLPLKPTYASCVAQANSDNDAPYHFRFQQRSLIFRVDLRSINRNPSTPAAITYRAVLTSRPYVRWAIAD